MTQHTAASGPLAGVTVLDITRVVAGPFCSMLLAELGATVIKVEHPDEPDYARTFPPMVAHDDDEFSAFFAQYNRNKQGITLNMKTVEGKQLLRQLVRKADILVENFRPGTMEKLGLGYEVLKQENPRLVYTAISGFGRTGPNASRPAYDNTGQAAGGLWSMNGYADRPPVRVGTIIGDLAASLYAAIGTLAALRQAERDGFGQVVDISQQDSVLTLTENAVVRYTTKGEVASPLGNDHPFVRPYGSFPCKDGYVFFGGYTDKFWRITCEMFGEPEVADDPEIDTMEKRFDPAVAERRVTPLLARWFGQHTKAELEEMAGDRVPLSAIKTIAEVVEDPHIAAREMIVNVPVAGKLVRMFGMPIKLSEAKSRDHVKAPTPGEH
ncbi:CoA transferase, partial [Tianweitania sp.]|uniref:CaiB/BaiF CoA transferase family protein n=1 Tax=Tianweitania sp. TaxID=2021634 RepID=UPI00289A7202